MPKPELNIIVCVAGTCGPMDSMGHSFLRHWSALLKTMRSTIGLKSPIACILGCTYGPRIDVAKRWAGEKSLYGTMEGKVTISIRGRVKMLKIPAALLDLALDNLPES